MYKHLRGPGADGGVTRMTQSPCGMLQGKISLTGWLHMCACPESVTLSWWIVKTPLAATKLYTE